MSIEAVCLPQRAAVQLLGMVSSSPRSEIVDLLQFLRTQRSKIPAFAESREAMGAYIDETRAKLIAKHMRFKKVYQAIKNHTGVKPFGENSLLFVQIHGARDREKGRKIVLPGKGYTATEVTYAFNGCMVTMLQAPYGKIYLFRAINKPFLMVFKAHFFDRLVARTEGDADRTRMEAVIDICKKLCLTHARTEQHATVKWDEQTLEQWMLIPEGLCLGYCARFPFQEDLLLWDPDTDDARPTVSPLALFNTFVSPEMFREDQVPIVEEMLDNIGQFGVL